MKQKMIKLIFGIVIILLLISSKNFSQTINAGCNQIINWEKTYSAHLKGSVSPNKMKVEWTCPQNSKVVFTDASNPVTEVTFPRPDYYLLFLSEDEPGKDSIKSSIELPPMSNYDLIDYPRTYMYLKKTIFYPFGYGLSYTTFKFSNLKLNSNKIKKDDEVEIQFSIKNTGKMKGDEVAQVYVHKDSAKIKVPINQLKRFKRISLLPGDSKMLSFKIPRSDFSFCSTKTNGFKIYPGKWEIEVGSSYKDIRLKKTITIK